MGVRERMGRVDCGCEVFCMVLIACRVLVVENMCFRGFAYILQSLDSCEQVP